MLILALSLFGLSLVSVAVIFSLLGKDILGLFRGEISSDMGTKSVITIWIFGLLSHMGWWGGWISLLIWVVLKLTQ